MTEPLKRGFCESSSARQHVVHVVAEFYPWIKFYFPLFRLMVTYDNEFKTKAFKIRTKDKIEPQYIYTYEWDPAKGDTCHCKTNHTK